MAKTPTSTLNELIDQTKRVRTVFWGRTIDGLGPAALQVLVAVKVAKSETETTAGAIAETIGIAPPAASTELTKLAKEGYVTRQQLASEGSDDASSERVHHLLQSTALTRRGEAAIAAVVEKAREHDRA